MFPVNRFDFFQKSLILVGLLALSTLAVGCDLTDESATETAATSAAATDAPTLAWIGDAHLRVGDTYVPMSMVPAGRDLGAFVQTYPAGAAARVDVFWADANYANVGSALMDLDSDNAGAFGNNSQWRAAIPASVVVANSALHYWLRAEDSHGNVLWDSAGGANYTVVPRGYGVTWVGGFGAFRPVNAEYVEGGLFNSDNSTSTGCWNHGVSLSSFRSRSVRVYVPGLTDQPLSSAEEMAAATAILRAELYTDASPDGWVARPARFVKRVGNDFLYRFQFVTFNPGCVIGLDDGTFAFKIRVSTDDGASWFWRGSENGPYGGDDLLVQYAEKCSYFNNSSDCIPTETEITRLIWQQLRGVVVDYGNISIGASSTRTVDLVGGTRAVTLSGLALVGPDADQFEIELFDDATNQSIPVDGTYLIEQGITLRVVLVFRPLVSSPGQLPHQAKVVWQELSSSGPPIPSEVSGIYLRGRS